MAKSPFTRQDLGEAPQPAAPARADVGRAPAGVVRRAARCHDRRDLDAAQVAFHVAESAVYADCVRDLSQQPRLSALDHRSTGCPL